MIFLTFNPNQEIFESLALRTQTLASLYNTSILLPDRYGTKSLKYSTKERIEKADWLLALTTNQISRQVQSEIKHARIKGKKALVIYTNALISDYGVISGYGLLVKPRNAHCYILPPKINPVALLPQIMSNMCNKEGLVCVKELESILGILLGMLGLHILEKVKEIQCDI